MAFALQDWHTASLQRPEQPHGQEWAWTRWSIDIPVPAANEHNGELNIICKAVDTSYNNQPDTSKSIWNLRGILNNSWHRVPVKVNSAEPVVRADEPQPEQQQEEEAAAVVAQLPQLESQPEAQPVESATKPLPRVNLTLPAAWFRDD